MQIHITDIELGSEHRPMPLEIISELAASVESRFLVAPWLIGKIPSIEIFGLAVTELATCVQTHIKSGPLAFWRHRRDGFHFFPTVRSSPGQRAAQRAAGKNDTHPIN